MTYKIFIYTFLLLILSTGIGFGQIETPPEGGEPKDFTFPPVETMTLDNGLQVSLVPYGNLPRAVVRAVMRIGNINEQENEVWLADLTAEMLKEGTTSLTAAEIARKAAGFGGEISVSTGMDQSWAGGEVLGEFTSDMIYLIADILINPSFPEKEFGRLKNDYLRNLSIAKTQPQQLASEKFLKVLYGNHPYGRLFPTEEMLRNYSLDQIKKFYEENYGAVRTHLYVAGKFDQKAVKEAIRSAFSDWKKGNEPVAKPAQAKSERKIYLVNRSEAPQSTIYIGIPVEDPSHEDYTDLRVMNTLLGGYFSSRITANIREDKGYTYSPHSYISSHYRDAYWIQVADVSTEVTGASIREIFYEIDRLKEEKPSESELNCVQNYMAGTFVLRNSNRSGIINQLAFINLHGLSKEYLDNYIQNIYTVNPQDIRDIAKKYLQEDRMTIVIVGDEKKIPAQVKEFAEIQY